MLSVVDLNTVINLDTHCIVKKILLILNILRISSSGDGSDHGDDDDVKEEKIIAIAASHFSCIFI
jgi:hypothetical protein